MYFVIHQCIFGYIDVFSNTSVYIWIHWMYFLIHQCIFGYIDVFSVYILIYHMYFLIHQCIFGYIDVFNTSVYFEEQLMVSLYGNELMLIELKGRQSNTLPSELRSKYINFFFEALIINLPLMHDKFNIVKTYLFI